jgi:hypothetical protein
MFPHVLDQWHHSMITNNEISVVHFACGAVSVHFCLNCELSSVPAISLFPPSPGHRWFVFSTISRNGEGGLAWRERSAVDCSAVQCGTVQCSAVQCSAVQYSAVQYSAVRCSAVQCGSRRLCNGLTAYRCAWKCSAVQCSAVRCSAV